MTYYIQEEASPNQFYTIFESDDKDEAVRECQRIEKRNHNRGGYRVIDEKGNWIY